MTFFGNIVYLRPRSVTCGPSAARDANDTTRAQINNIPGKNHFIIIIINIQGQIISRYLRIKKSGSTLLTIAFVKNDHIWPF